MAPVSWPERLYFSIAGCRSTKKDSPLAVFLFCNIVRLQVLGEELLQSLASCCLVLALDGDVQCIALLYTHTHQAHQTGCVNSLAVLVQGNLARKALNNLNQLACRTSVDAQCVLNRVIKLLHIPGTSLSESVPEG